MESIGELTDRAVGRRTARGRQDRSKQEKVIDMSKLTEKIDHLVNLHKATKDASADYSAAIKVVAEKAGLLASVVRRFVVAKAGESFDDKKKEAEQLALVFDEIKG